MTNGHYEVMPSGRGILREDYYSQPVIESPSPRLYAEQQIAGSLALRASLEDQQSPDTVGWKTRGSCDGLPTDSFFPKDSVGVDAARKVCDNCPVKQVCLEYALENKIEYGVWGGTSERQRRVILKQRRMNPKAVA